MSELWQLLNPFSLLVLWTLRYRVYLFKSIVELAHLLLA